jgi:hypothetical protein
MLATFVLLGLLAASDGSLRGENAPSLETIEGHLKARAYGEAAAGARARLSSLEAGGAVESVEGARLLDILVEAAWRGGLEDPEAPTLGERAVALRTRLAGPDDPSVATSLHLLGNLSQARGDAAASRRPSWRRGTGDDGHVAADPATCSKERWARTVIPVPSGSIATFAACCRGRRGTRWNGISWRVTHASSACDWSWAQRW